MERKPRSTAVTIVLIITYILVVVPLGAVALLALQKAVDAYANTIMGNVAVDITVNIAIFFGAIVIPIFLAICSLERIQSKRKRKCYVICNYSYAAALLLLGVLMVYVASTRSEPFGGLIEVVFGIISFAAAALTAFSLTIAVIIFHFRQRKGRGVSGN